MTKQEQLATLVCVSEFLNDYVADLAYCGVITEKEAEPFDGFIEKIDKVAEEIRHEAIPPAYVYTVWEDCCGIIGYHKTFEGAKKQLMEHSVYKEHLKEFPLDCESETCWGWDILCIDRIELEK